MPLPNSAAIKAIRLAKGYTGTEIAEHAGITHGHFFNLENPARNKCASDEVLESIADYLAVPVAAIVVPEPVTRRLRGRRGGLKQAA